MKFRNHSGHTFESQAQAVIDIFTTSDMSAFALGQVVRDESGSRYIIAQSNHISGNLFRLTLLPQETV